MTTTDPGNRIEIKIAEIHAVAHNFPGIIIIHNVMQEFKRVEYMSPRGLQILDITMEELHRMGENYFPRFFNMEDAEDYLPKIFELMQENSTDKVYSFFQQVRKSPADSWQWYFSSVKILLRNRFAAPLLCITFAAPINPLAHLHRKTYRLLEENTFLRKHFKEFSSLTVREMEVVRELAAGFSAADIAKKLYITLDTIKTHRKNIYRKLHISSSYQLQQYARAFDLL